MLSAAATLTVFPVAAQDAPAGGTDPQPTAESTTLPSPQPPREYWPLLLTGIGLTAGGLVGARLAHLETERWEAMTAGTADRQQQIDTWSTVTVAGSVAAAVGVGLIALWATIRLSQADPAPAAGR